MGNRQIVLSIHFRHARTKVRADLALSSTMAEHCAYAYNSDMSAHQPQRLSFGSSSPLSEDSTSTAQRFFTTKILRRRRQSSQEWAARGHEICRQVRGAYRLSSSSEKTSKLMDDPTLNDDEESVEESVLSEWTAPKTTRRKARVNYAERSIGTDNESTVLSEDDPAIVDDDDDKEEDSMEADQYKDESNGISWLDDDGPYFVEDEPQDEEAEEEDRFLDPLADQQEIFVEQRGLAQYDGGEFLEYAAHDALYGLADDHDNDDDDEDLGMGHWTQWIVAILQLGALMPPITNALMAMVPESTAENLMDATQINPIDCLNDLFPTYTGTHKWVGVCW